MSRFLAGVGVTLLLVAIAAGWIWYQKPELLPETLRRQNPQSVQYSPAVYRWKDAQGRTQISDTPPKDQPYETVRIDPATNIVPDVGPRERDARRRD